MGVRTRLGEVTVPSGTLAVVDAGMLGLDQYDELAVEIGDVPAGTPLTVVGERLDANHSGSGLRWVGIEILPGVEPASSRPAGEVFVDFANVLFADRRSLDGWEHDRSLDGRADLVFRGRDARDVAASVGAERLDDGWGWLNLPAADCERKARLVEEIVRQNDRAIEIDHRPHSHLHRLQLQMQAAPQGAGEIDLDNARLCAVRTVPGKGQFRVMRDLAPDGRLARIRVELVAQAEQSSPAGPEPMRRPASRAEHGKAGHKPTEAANNTAAGGEPVASLRAKPTPPETAAPRPPQPRPDTNRKKSEKAARDAQRATRRVASGRAAGTSVPAKRPGQRQPRRSPARRTAKPAGRVRAPKPAAAVQVARDGDRLILITPHGHRIEGLPPEDLIELLEALEKL